MFNKRHSKPQERIDSLIGAAVKIEGNLTFSGGLRVDGEITGNVIAVPGESSTLVLSEHGRINGEVSVTHLVANGVVTGSVSVSEYMELQSKSRITGDINYNTLEIHLGAIVEGMLIHLADAATANKVVALKLSSVE